MEKGLNRQRQLYGDSPTSVLMLMNLGQNSRAAGDVPAALGYFREAADIQIKKGGGRLRVNRDLPGFYLEAINAAVQATPADRPALMAEAVTAAQLVRDRTTAECAPAHGDPGGRGQRGARVGDARHPGQRPSQDPLTLDARAGAGPPGARSAMPAGRTTLKDQLREAEAKDESLEQRLQAEFPKYARLSRPGALTADEVRAPAPSRTRPWSPSFPRRSRSGCSSSRAATCPCGARR